MTVAVGLSAANWVRETVPRRGHKKRLLDSPQIFSNCLVMLLRPYTQFTDALNSERRVPINGKIRAGFMVYSEMQRTLRIRPTVQRCRLLLLRPLLSSCSSPELQSGLKDCALLAGPVAT